MHAEDEYAVKIDLVIVVPQGSTNDTETVPVGGYEEDGAFKTHR